MNETKYIGMDVHQATTSIVILNSSGRVVFSGSVETKGADLVAFIQAQRGTLHLTFEEGTHAAWLYDLLVPYVHRLVVCDPRRNALLKTGSKNDPADAQKLAELLRLNALRPVYHGQQSLRTLKELSRSYVTLVQDSTRVMNRIKALYRSRAIPCGGTQVYAPGQRSNWVEQLQGAGVRQRAELLYQHLDLLSLLRRQAKQALLEESRKYLACRLLCAVPGLGPVRVAILLAMVQTPARFRNKRLFWAYVGLGLVTRISAEYTVVNGQLKRSTKAPSLRGLNPNHQRELKEIFKSAASAAVRRPGPWQEFYQQRVAAGRKPELVRLTVARKLAALALHLWKKGERYDVKQVKSTAV
jgi:transposase